jgi:hypothetical protein
MILTARKKPDLSRERRERRRAAVLARICGRRGETPGRAAEVVLRGSSTYGLPMTDPKDHDEDQDDLDGEEEEEEEEEEESPAPPPAKSKPKGSDAKSSVASAKASKPAAITSTQLIGIGVAALLVGGAAGWFGHIQKGKAELRAAVAAAPAGSGVPAGPCGAWQSNVCKSMGDQSAACQQAKAAAGVLSTPACELALRTLPETLAKIKAERASCDKLVAKLCAELPPGSKTCEMVKERTPSFPTERCDQMTQNYNKVIAELKQMDQQQGATGAPMGAPGGGMRPPGMPGGPPHAQSAPPAGHP